MHVSGLTIQSPDPPILVGDSPAMRLVREEVAAAARTSAKVLIVVETGTGKEVVARLIHTQSARRGGPFVAVNSSGIPETLLESELFGHTRGSFTGADRDTGGLVRQAKGGTLFLDELGEMSTRMQAVLLRFTETGEIQPVGSERPAERADVRLITATNRNLRAQIAAGAFREDLYYRLNVIQIRIPPLRDRAEDILPLVQHYLERAGATHRLPVPGLTPDVAQLLVGYAWPGNVRELRNIAERLVLQEAGALVTPDNLPREIRGSMDERVALPAAPARVSEDADSTIRSTPFTALSPDRVAQLWDRMVAGKDFWSVVYRAFKARDLTRGELAALMKVFNLPPADYKRFHAFLYQRECNLPVALYRRRKPRRQAEVRRPARWVA